MITIGVLFVLVILTIILKAVIIVIDDKIWPVGVEY